MTDQSADSHQPKVFVALNDDGASSPLSSSDFSISGDHRTLTWSAASAGQEWKGVYEGVYNAAFERSLFAKAVLEDVAHQAVAKGHDVTLACFGCVGTSKTETLFGRSSGTGEGAEGEEDDGLAGQLVQHLWQALEQSDESVEVTVRLSAAELYLEQLHDALRVQDDRVVHVDPDTGRLLGCYQLSCVSIQDVKYAMQRARLQRTLAKTTSTDHHSHRSTLLVQLTVEQRQRRHNYQPSLLQSTIRIVDLACCVGSGDDAHTTTSLGVMPHLPCPGIQALQYHVAAMATQQRALTTPEPHPLPTLVRLMLESSLMQEKCITRLVLTVDPSSSQEASATRAVLAFGSHCQKLSPIHLTPREASSCPCCGDAPKSSEDSMAALSPMTRENRWADLARALAGECIRLHENNSSPSPEPRHPGLWKIIHEIEKASNEKRPLNFSMETLREHQERQYSVQRKRRRLEKEREKQSQEQQERQVLRAQVHALQIERDELACSLQQQTLEAKHWQESMELRCAELEQSLWSSQFREAEAVILLRQYRRFNARLWDQMVGGGSQNGEVMDAFHDAITSSSEMNESQSALLDLDRILIDSGFLDEDEVFERSVIASTAEMTGGVDQKPGNANVIPLGAQTRTLSTILKRAEPASMSEARQVAYQTPLGKYVVFREDQLARELQASSNKCAKLEKELRHLKTLWDAEKGSAANSSSEQKDTEGVQLQLQRNQKVIAALGWKMNELVVVGNELRDKLERQTPAIQELETSLADCQEQLREHQQRHEQQLHELQAQLLQQKEATTKLIEASETPPSLGGRLIVPFDVRNGEKWDVDPIANRRNSNGEGAKEQIEFWTAQLLKVAENQFENETDLIQDAQVQTDGTQDNAPTLHAETEAVTELEKLQQQLLSARKEAALLQSRLRLGENDSPSNIQGKDAPMGGLRLLQQLSQERMSELEKKIEESQRQLSPLRSKLLNDLSAKESSHAELDDGIDAFLFIAEEDKAETDTDPPSDDDKQEYTTIDDQQTSDTTEKPQTGEKVKDARAHHEQQQEEKAAHRVGRPTVSTTTFTQKRSWAKPASLSENPGALPAKPQSGPTSLRAHLSTYTRKEELKDGSIDPNDIGSVAFLKKRFQSGGHGPSPSQSASSGLTNDGGDDEEPGSVADLKRRFQHSSSSVESKLSGSGRNEEPTEHDDIDDDAGSVADLKKVFQKKDTTTDDKKEHALKKYLDAVPSDKVRTGPVVSKAPVPQWNASLAGATRTDGRAVETVAGKKPSTVAPRAAPFNIAATAATPADKARSVVRTKSGERKLTLGVAGSSAAAPATRDGQKTSEEPNTAKTGTSVFDELNNKFRTIGGRNRGEEIIEASGHGVARDYTRTTFGESLKLNAEAVEKAVPTVGEGEVITSTFGSRPARRMSEVSSSSSLLTPSSSERSLSVSHHVTSTPQIAAPAVSALDMGMKQSTDHSPTIEQESFDPAVLKNKFAAKAADAKPLVPDTPSYGPSYSSPKWRPKSKNEEEIRIDTDETSTAEDAIADLQAGSLVNGNGEAKAPSLGATDMDAINTQQVADAEEQNFPDDVDATENDSVDDSEVPPPPLEGRSTPLDTDPAVPESSAAPTTPNTRTRSIRLSYSSTEEGSQESAKMEGSQESAKMPAKDLAAESPGSFAGDSSDDSSDHADAPPRNKKKGKAAARSRSQSPTKVRKGNAPNHGPGRLTKSQSSSKYEIKRGRLVRKDSSREDAAGDLSRMAKSSARSPPNSPGTRNRKTLSSMLAAGGGDSQGSKSPKSAGGGKASYVIQDGRLVMADDAVPQPKSLEPEKSRPGLPNKPSFKIVDGRLIKNDVQVIKKKKKQKKKPA